jgi:AcrR family transcriptional regulator
MLLESKMDGMCASVPPRAAPGAPVDSPGWPVRHTSALQRDERRALLLERATQLFGEHGHDALSMARIAREAKISKALPYHYPPSRRSCRGGAGGKAGMLLGKRSWPLVPSGR